MSLKNLVNVFENNANCVILEVKPNSFKELIKLGCFSGNETMIRLTKGKEHTCTIWEGTSNYSWHWGESGYTMVSHGMNQKRNLIVETITKDFGIRI